MGAKIARKIRSELIKELITEKQYEINPCTRFWHVNVNAWRCMLYFPIIAVLYTTCVLQIKNKYSIYCIILKLTELLLSKWVIIESTLNDMRVHIRRKVLYNTNHLYLLNLLIIWDMINQCDTIIYLGAWFQTFRNKICNAPKFVCMHFHCLMQIRYFEFVFERYKMCWTDLINA